ncbi:uncharacterized protein B0I36DRAFT_350977 [Microdochium trichocladiopsis]|uniref:Uncharacterized protein n=1 Tax=Microdochium trichocladiopsis TaxID=1682393 RepID=A0A9P8Y1H0_9PEZI|nr:uncharacterized protein B0I36DRAFT_350977 [Microdochium trichocladiopsis]KAH7027450.1 hypothetical protein B0I36DRAFT_350977 [Microdochium trichocladiopsis]
MIDRVLGNNIMGDILMGVHRYVTKQPIDMLWPEMDADRVEAFHKDVASGRYNINPQQVLSVTSIAAVKGQDKPDYIFHSCGMDDAKPKSANQTGFGYGGKSVPCLVSPGRLCVGYPGNNVPNGTGVAADAEELRAFTVEGNVGGDTGRRRNLVTANPYGFFKPGRGSKVGFTARRDAQPDGMRKMTR